MATSEPEDHLSRIVTLWTMVRDAHDPSSGGVSKAQEQLLERYSGAVHRYLLGALQDSQAADDLYQDFCLRFLRGNFRNVDPKRGRFRDYLKVALCHLVTDYHRRQQAAPRMQPLESISPDVQELITEPQKRTDADVYQDGLYKENWIKTLRERAWHALEERDLAILRIRSENPELSSAELAERLASLWARALTITNTRKMLHDARQRFADLLLEEVIRSLEQPTTEQLHEELIDLGLYGYCKAALARRGLG